MVLLLLSVLACRNEPDDKGDGPVDTEQADDSAAPIDADGDGFTADEDCNDADASINPAAEEICDGVDQDCDGVVDNDPVDPTTFYADADGDGYGDPASPVEACEPGEGTLSDASDCDDSDPAVFPGADEVCNGIDDDCDTLIDDDDPDLLDPTTWYTDADSDGFGDDASSVQSCVQPGSTSATPGDCDDSDAAFNPGAAEEDCTDPNDYNCDGSVGYADADGDGWAACEECDDGDSAINPDASEVCDGADNDCDGTVDNDDAVDASTWYADTDSDGFGDPASSTSACDEPSGFTSDDQDCDDSDGAINPDATEICDDVDQDCDGDVDEEASDALTWYLDGDSDGYGDSSSSTEDCDQPTGYVSSSDDCDDAEGAVNPGATEVCNDIDDDCDGDVDGGATDESTWYADADCDGFGDSATSTTSCDAPSGYVSDDTDCDDGEGRSNPDAVEICDSSDNDCDGTADTDCVTPIEIDPPSELEVDAPSTEAACALIGELDAVADPHDSSNLSTFMSALVGGSGYVDSTSVDAETMDWSNRCTSTGDYGASPGNFSPTNDWPTLTTTGDYGAARFRGYLNIGCGEALNYTIGLMGNDSVSLSIEGQDIMTVNWSDGQWKKFRYISFPEPGLYAFEVQWATNLNCEIDPFELVWAPGFLDGYDAYDTMCASSSCTYATGTPIPDFSVIEGDSLVQSTDGAGTDCAQCESDADCDTGANCNTAGICE